jgi:hypothetical protein
MGNSTSGAHCLGNCRAPAACTFQSMKQRISGCYLKAPKDERRP